MAQRCLDAVLTASTVDASGLADVSDTRLTSLRPGSLSKEILQSVVRLSARNNRITSFDGMASLPKTQYLDVTENGFRSVDLRNGEALAQSPNLATLMCSGNNISFVDLDGIARHFAHLRPAPFAMLRTLDLSGNILTEVPNIACCYLLENLNLAGNQIERCDNMGERLPRSIQTLSLARNAIDHWYSLIDLLLQLTDVMLIFDVQGNPCVEVAAADGFDFAVFVASLASALNVLNGSTLTVQQRGLAADILQHVDIQQPPDALRDALCQWCPALPVNTVNDLQGLVTATDFDALVAKVQKLSATVTVLRAEDKKKRRAAAIKIQSAWRMFAVRNRLAKQYQRHFPRVSTSVVAHVRSAVQHTNATSARLETRMETVEAAVRQVWVDLAHLRGYLHSKRVFAAVTLQKYWRGCVARRKYAAIRREFMRFAANFIPAIVRIQAFARMVVAKRAIRPLRRQFRRQHELERQVDTLRGEVGELRSLVLQLMGQAQAGLQGAEARARANQLLMRPPVESLKQPAAAAPNVIAPVAVAAAAQGRSAPSITRSQPVPDARIPARRTDSPANIPSSASPSPLDGTSPEAKPPIPAVEAIRAPVAQKPLQRVSDLSESLSALSRDPAVAQILQGRSGMPKQDGATTASEKLPPRSDNASNRRMPPAIPQMVDVPAHLKPKHQDAATYASKVPAADEWRRHAPQLARGSESTISALHSHDGSSDAPVQPTSRAANRSDSELSANAVFRPVSRFDATKAPSLPAPAAVTGDLATTAIAQTYENDDVVRCDDDDDDDVDDYTDEAFDDDGAPNAFGARDIDFAGVVAADDVRFDHFTRHGTAAA